MTTVLPLLLLILPIALSEALIQCAVCNTKPGEDDGAPCLEQMETCHADVSSCSLATWTHPVTGRRHVRKFCTAPGTPVNQHLLLFPGSAHCERTSSLSSPSPPLSAPVAGEFARRKRSSPPMRAGPPAPPTLVTSQSLLLCVCPSALCNAGEPEQVVMRSLLPESFASSSSSSSSSNSLSFPSGSLSEPDNGLFFF